MPRRTATLLPLILALAAGCKAKPAKPADPPPAAPQAVASRPTATPEPRLPDPAADAVELEARSITAMQRLADALAGHAGNCDQVAGDLRAFVTGNKPMLGQLLAQQQQHASDGQRAAFAQRPAAIAVAHKLQAAMAMCAANPAVVAAMREFPAD
ncbi:MAG TPA: hypothetical protein VK607_02065 [Kofleriaceae bacterium]|nr:hypothetical protein [Kofleriaceae bacterium]